MKVTLPLQDNFTAAKEGKLIVIDDDTSKHLCSLPQITSYSTKIVLETRLIPAKDAEEG
jgi:hypothetical protein